ncbi:P-loop containing nucleoside triphosphate hydrolase protein [Rozella allomycis CSF55]|uniref:P-loop containing nucleoside triphosphate hydrolase protein n=1 Tax=Rozella allomycis (strain CSF55) TaxID=988480 RepID=A0A4P9YDR0_ROZAC|nr:P-loop containing nucleoside triphosphate hydrolase protein [Rozella allomycis CSF55]
MSNFLYSTINSLGSLYRQSRHSNSQRSSKAAKLPVSSFKDQIMDALEDNTVVIISGTTGSGKSTQVPQFILDHDKSHVKIACTQPRRLAAVSLALRVAHERKDTSRLVGYHISGKNNCSKATKLMYMTTGATLVPQKYQNYFSEFGSVPFIHIPTKMHEIEIVYVEDICDKFKASHEVKSGVLEAPDRPMLTPSRKNLLADMIMSLHKSLPLNQAILVFLSGLSPILEIADKLTLYENSESMQIHLLHSSITIEEQAQIVRPPAKGKRKVVLSTNVAESSLTIADARIVIDTCLKKDMDFDVSFNGFSLNECWVSKNCAEQRKGRVGRTSPGIVYRLITKNEFEKLRQEQLPEIQRSELSNCVLRCLSIPSHPFFEVLSSCMDPPLNKHINEALKTLISLKAVSFNNGSYSATRLGHILSTVPLNVKNCLLALHGIIFGVGEEAIIAACILQLKSVFIESPVLELETSKAMASFGSSIKREKMEISSDLISNLRAYLFWRENYPENDKEEFYLKYFLSKFFLQEVHDLIILVREGFSKFGLCEPPSDDERASLHKKFKSLMVHSSQVDDFDNFDFMDDFNQQESQQVESFVQKFNEISFNLSNKKIFENGNSIFHINDPGSRVTKGETIKLKKEPNIFTFSIILCASFYSNVLKFDTSENPESCAFPSEFDLTRSVEFGADILPSIPDMLQFLNNKISPVSKYLIINNRIQVEFQGNFTFFH